MYFLLNMGIFQPAMLVYQRVYLFFALKFLPQKSQAMPKNEHGNLEDAAARSWRASMLGVSGYPPVIKHSWLENPHFQYGIHLQKVHFPASYVRLPECKLYQCKCEYSITSLCCRLSTQMHIIWSNYSDLTRPHPKWWFSIGNPMKSPYFREI